MSETELAQILEALGSDGITAFYIYLASHQFENLLVFGCIVWGIRVMWTWFKNTHDKL